MGNREKIVAITAFILGVTIACLFQLVSSKSLGDRAYIIANFDQIHCMNSLSNSNFEAKSILGPSWYSDYKVVEVDTESIGTSFEYEFSACFYMAHSEKLYSVEEFRRTYILMNRTKKDKIFAIKKEGVEYFLIYSN